MKGIAAVVAVAAAALVFACARAGAEATSETLVVNVPYENVTKSPCVAEKLPFPVEGAFHQTLHVGVDANGGIHLVNEIDAYFTGTSPSGVTYVGDTATRFEQQLVAAGEYTFLTQILFIAEGESTPADDFLLEGLNHVTVNANGEVTASTFELGAECQ